MGCGGCGAALVFTGVAFRTGGSLDGVGGNGRTGSLVRGCVVRVVLRVALPCVGILELAVPGTGCP